MNLFNYGKITGIDSKLEELDNASCAICGVSQERMNRLHFADGNTEIVCDSCKADFERIQHLF